MFARLLFLRGLLCYTCIRSGRLGTHLLKTKALQQSPIIIDETLAINACILHFALFPLLIVGSNIAIACGLLNFILRLWLELDAPQRRLPLLLVIELFGFLLWLGKLIRSVACLRCGEGVHVCRNVFLLFFPLSLSSLLLQVSLVLNLRLAPQVLG